MGTAGIAWLWLQVFSLSLDEFWVFNQGVQRIQAKKNSSAKLRDWAKFVLDLFLIDKVQAIAN